MPLFIHNFTDKTNDVLNDWCSRSTSCVAEFLWTSWVIYLCTVHVCYPLVFIPLLGYITWCFTVPFRPIHRIPTLCHTQVIMFLWCPWTSQKTHLLWTASSAKRPAAWRTAECSKGYPEMAGSAMMAWPTSPYRTKQTSNQRKRIIYN